MKTFIFIAGAPGSGKSSVAAALQGRLDSPMFEFGWIPEFRNTGTKSISYVEDEALAFENLVLVTKNYAKHGFKNIIMTDLQDARIHQLADVFKGYDYMLFTLRLRDEEVLKARVLDESRSSGYRDWEEALRINRNLLTRETLTNETFVDLQQQSVDELASLIVQHLD